LGSALYDGKHQPEYAKFRSLRRGRKTPAAAMAIEIMARAAWFEGDGYNECIVAGFSGFADGSGLAFHFQAAIYEPGEQR
jgi:hypothetical protein